MNSSFKYFAFISYKREDEKWAKWLQNKLETYKLPSSLPTEDGKEYPKTLRPCFRDKADLGETGDLTKILHDKLEKSQYLIVICSPRSAKSEWVNEEIQTFQAMGRANKIIPFIIEGTPNSLKLDTHCYPPKLNDNILGISVPELIEEKVSEKKAAEKAAVKVIAAMLHVDFDTLWNRELRRKKHRKIKNIVILLLFFVLLMVCAIFFVKKIKKANELIGDAEKSYLTLYEEYIKAGNVPKKLYKLYCDLNTKYSKKNIKIDSLNTLNTMKFSPIDGSKLLILGNDRRDALIWNINSEEIEDEIDKQDTTSFDKIFYSNDGKYIFGLLNNDKMCIWNDKGLLIKSFNGYTDEYFKIWRDSLFFDNWSEYIKCLRRQRESVDWHEKNLNELKINQLKEPYIKKESEKYLEFNEKTSCLIDLFYESYFKEIYLNQNVSSNLSQKMPLDPIWSIDGKYVIVNDINSVTDLYAFDYRNFSTEIPSFLIRHDPVARKQYYKRINLKIISPDNQWGVQVDEEGRIKKISMSGSIYKEYSEPFGSIVAMYITPDSEYLIFYTTDNRLYIANAQGDVRPVSFPKGISNIVLSPKSDFCYVIDKDENVFIYSMNVKTQKTHISANNIAIDNTGSHIIFYNDSLIVSTWLGLESLYNYVLKDGLQKNNEEPSVEETINPKDMSVDKFPFKWYHGIGIYLFFKYLYEAIRFVYKKIRKKGEKETNIEEEVINIETISNEQEYNLVVNHMYKLYKRAKKKKFADTSEVDELDFLSKLIEEYENR